MELKEGILQLTIEKADLKHDTESFGKMSPYVTVVFKGHKLKTKVHNHGGKQPVWGDSFSLEVEDPSEEIILRVWDQDMTTSDAVGFVKVKMSSLMLNMGVEDKFEIYFDNKPAGDVFLKTVFEPKGGNAYEQALE